MFAITNLRIKIPFSFAVTLILLGILVQPALADGIVIPDPPPFPDPILLEDTWLTIRYHRVSVRIDNQVAVTHVEQEFLNEYDWEVEGTYIFPIPLGGSISEFVMWVDGVPLDGKILPADEAKKIYEDIVRKRRDPALLEYIGQDAVQARIFPIPAGGSRKIELEYTQILSVDNGLVKYSYPLNTEKFSARALEDCSVRIELTSDQALHSVYSPSHQDRIFIDRDGNHRAVVGYEEQYVLPDQDFDLIYTISEEDIGINLLTFPDLTYSENNGREGYFLLMAAPTIAVDQIVPRDIILVLDTSGSMDGEKILQAKAASRYILNHLNEEDRFNVITFSTGIKHFAMNLQPVSKTKDAIPWIERMDALGGTNINMALLEALSQREDLDQREGGRPLLVLFLTDGLPTEGVTEIDQIIANVGSTATSNVRLFAFGVGDDVNTLLLDRLAGENRGVSSYVRPNERIDEEVSGLFAKIKTPVLTDLSLDFGNVLVEELYPPVLPDLFSGTQLVLTGRYRLSGISSGSTKITLSGYVNDRQKNLSYSADFLPEYSQSENHFIPRLWAARKIGYLLSQIRIQGENSEWIDAIIQLSLQYGIITPYTSFLIVEHDILAGEGLEEAAKEIITEFAAPAYGAEAVGQADAESNLRSSESVYQPSLSGDDYQEYGQPAIKYIDEKTFKLEDGIWVDTVYDPRSMSPVRIGFGTDVYFDLLSTRPSWGKYLALGEQVIFVFGDTAYEIGSEPGDFDTLPPDLSQPEEVSLTDLGQQQTQLPSIKTICAGPLFGGMAILGLVLSKFW